MLQAFLITIPLVPSYIQNVSQNDLLIQIVCANKRPKAAMWHKKHAPKHNLTILMDRRSNNRNCQTSKSLYVSTRISCTSVLADTKIRPTMLWLINELVVLSSSSSLLQCIRLRCTHACAISLVVFASKTDRQTLALKKPVGYALMRLRIRV